MIKQFSRAREGTLRPIFDLHQAFTFTFSRQRRDPPPDFLPPPSFHFLHRRLHFIAAAIESKLIWFKVRQGLLYTWKNVERGQENWKTWHCDDIHCILYSPKLHILVKTAFAQSYCSFICINQLWNTYKWNLDPNHSPSSCSLSLTASARLLSWKHFKQLTRPNKQWQTHRAFSSIAPNLLSVGAATLFMRLAKASQFCFWL